MFLINLKQIKILHFFDLTRPSLIIIRKLSIKNNWVTLNYIYILIISKKNQLMINTNLKYWSRKQKQIFGKILYNKYCKKSNLLINFRKFKPKIKSQVKSKILPINSWKAYFEKINFIKRYKGCWRDEAYLPYPKKWSQYFKMDTNKDFIWKWEKLKKNWKYLSRQNSVFLKRNKISLSRRLTWWYSGYFNIVQFARIHIKKEWWFNYAFLIRRASYKWARLKKIPLKKNKLIINLFFCYFNYLVISWKELASVKKLNGAYVQILFQKFKRTLIISPKKIRHAEVVKKQYLQKYPLLNLKQYWYGPRFIAKEDVDLLLDRQETRRYNFYKPRFSQNPTTPRYYKFLFNYYIKHKAFSLYEKDKFNNKYSGTNFFCVERKILRLFTHCIDKFVYCRYPYIIQHYQTNYDYPAHDSYASRFQNVITGQHRFRWVFRLSYAQLVQIYKKIINYTKGFFEYLFFKHIEIRIETIVYRLNIAFSLKQARRWVERGLFVVNDRWVTWPKYQVFVGDIIIPIFYVRCHIWPKIISIQNIGYDFGYIYTTTRLFLRPIHLGQYGKHLLLNERIPAGLICYNPSIDSIYHRRPLSIQFITLSLLNYS